jgi:plastocyanin
LGGRLGVRTKTVAIAAAVAFVLVACGSGDEGGGGGEPPDGGGGASSADITISGLAFRPSDVTVHASDATITIANEDSFTHTFTTDDGSVDEEIDGGETVEVTLDGASGDELGFHCRIHPSMTGTVTFG